MYLILLLTRIYSYSSLGGTWNATSNSVVNTADSLIGTLLSVKEQMHNTLENFDSQESLSHHTNTIADKLNATMIGISGYGAQLGVFDALDNIMGGVRNVSMGLAVIPEKVSLFFKRKFKMLLELSCCKNQETSLENRGRLKVLNDTKNLSIYNIIRCDDGPT